MSRLDDDVVALCALDALEGGNLSGVDTSVWEGHMAAEQLTREHWLLA